MKRDARNIASMTFESEEGVRVRGLDIVELDTVVTRGSQESIVRRDTKAIDL